MIEVGVGNSLVHLNKRSADNLPWNKARIKFVARFLLALYAMRTVNLSILATAFSGTAKDESNYKRLQRFLRGFEMPYAQLALFVVKLLGVPDPYTLALDRTNWKVSVVDLNLLMLSIVYRGVGVPVVWIVLSKAGNSDTGERMTVMEIFLDLFGAQNIACLLGDREFVGRAWFRFLKRHRIKFQMRLHRDTLVRNGRGQYVQAWRTLLPDVLFCFSDLGLRNEDGTESHHGLFGWHHDPRSHEDHECFTRLSRIGMAAYFDCETVWQCGHSEPRLTEVNTFDKAEYLTRARYLIRKGQREKAREELRLAEGGPWSIACWQPCPTRSCGGCFSYTNICVS